MCASKMPKHVVNFKHEGSPAEGIAIKKCALVKWDLKGLVELCGPQPHRPEMCPVPVSQVHEVHVQLQD